MRLKACAALLLAGLSASLSAAAAQQPEGCGGSGVNLGECAAVAQSLHSAVPQVGIALSGGSPLAGLASVGGVRLGYLPRVTAALRLGGASLTLPRLQGGDTPGRWDSQTVLSARLDAEVALYAGASSGTPGFGSLDLLLGAGVIPGRGRVQSSVASYAAGLRLGLLRETFTTPGVSLSGSYRRTGTVEIGQHCSLGDSGCGRGELGFALRDLGGRLGVGKRVGRLGVLGGVGIDHFHDPDAHFGWSDGQVAVYRTTRVSETRFSGFANLSYALPVGALTLEGGWMNGGDAIPGYTASGYSPGTGTPFGGLSLRLAL